MNDEVFAPLFALLSVMMAAGLINRPGWLTLIAHQKYKRAMCQGTESIVTVEGVVIAFIAGGTANGSLGAGSPIRL